MTVTHDPISIAGLKPVTGKLVDLKQVDPERWARMKDIIEKMRFDSTPEGQAIIEKERAMQVAKQNAVEAHSIYRVNGKIIGVHYRDGITMSVSNSGLGHGNAESDGRQRGLSGERLNDYVADRITAELTEKYGSALQVEQYDAGAAPTAGELWHEIYGPTVEQHKKSSDPAVRQAALDLESLMMMSRAYHA